MYQQVFEVQRLVLRSTNLPVASTLFAVDRFDFARWMLNWTWICHHFYWKFWNTMIFPTFCSDGSFDWSHYCCALEWHQNSTPVAGVQLHCVNVATTSVHWRRKSWSKDGSESGSGYWKVDVDWVVNDVLVERWRDHCRLYPRQFVVPMLVPQVFCFAAVFFVRVQLLA